MINPISDPYVSPNRTPGGNSPSGEDSAKHGSARGQHVYSTPKYSEVASAGFPEYARPRSSGGNSVPEKAESNVKGTPGSEKRVPDTIEEGHRCDGAGNTSDPGTTLRVPNFRKKS